MNKSFEFTVDDDCEAQHSPSESTDSDPASRIRQEFMAWCNAHFTELDPDVVNEPPSSTIAPYWTDVVAPDTVQSIQMTHPDPLIQDTISYPHASGNWTTIPFYNNQVYDTMAQSMFLPSTSPTLDRNTPTISYSIPRPTPAPQPFSHEYVDPSGIVTDFETIPTCYDSFHNGYTPLANDSTDAMWESFEDVPPSTLEDGQSEAYTLAGWGTIPYEIANNLFCSNYAYPVIIETFQMSRPYYSHIHTVFRVECANHFILHVGEVALFSNAMENSQGVMVQTVCFPNGLPLFNLKSQQIRCESSIEFDDTSTVTIYGEIYDDETIYAMIPQKVTVTYIGQSRFPLMIDGGYLFMAEECRADISNSLEKLQSLICGDEFIELESAESDCQVESQELESAESDCEVESQELESIESECESESLELESIESEPVDEDLDDGDFVDRSLRDHYASMSVEEFMQLNPDVQNAVRAALMPFTNLELEYEVDCLRDLVDSMKTWATDRSMTAQDRIGKFQVYECAVNSLLDRMYDVLKGSGLKSERGVE